MMSSAQPQVAVPIATQVHLCYYGRVFWCGWWWLEVFEVRRQWRTRREDVCQILRQTLWPPSVDRVMKILLCSMKMKVLENGSAASKEMAIHTLEEVEEMKKAFLQRMMEEIEEVIQMKGVEFNDHAGI